MSLKSLPKKVGNSIKARSNNVFQAIDFSTGGTLSLFVQTMLKSHQGFIKEKFDNLLLDLANNEISDEELFDFINDTKLQSNREFLSNMLIKNFHADNRITIFILAKLWANKIKNGALNYYESSLFTNINTFTHEDFKCFYELWKDKITIETSGYFRYTLQPQQEFYCDAQQKLFRLGILDQIKGGLNFAQPQKTNEKLISDFDGSEMAETLFNILENYFTCNPNA